MALQLQTLLAPHHTEGEAGRAASPAPLSQPGGAQSSEEQEMSLNWKLTVTECKRAPRGCYKNRERERERQKNDSLEGREGSNLRKIIYHDDQELTCCRTD